MNTNTIKSKIIMHLYKYPLYQKLKKNEDLNMLILGAEKYGFDYLDIVLQVSQNLGGNLKITLISDKEDFDSKGKIEYLNERPAFSEFFNVSEMNKNEDSYGDITFEKCEIKGVLSSHPDTNLVFVDLLDIEKRREVIAEISGSGFSGVVDYIDDAEDDLDVQRELEKIAFNIHMVWNNNKEIPYYVKRSKFQEEYNYYSSISNALSIKYKLWEVGIDIDILDKKEAGRQIKKLLQCDPKIREYLSWVEHKRWVTEKICDGWVGRSLEECKKVASTEIDVTRDIGKKRHVCIVRDTKELRLMDLNPSEWDSLGVDTQTFDELDRLSIELHRFYENQTKNIRISDFNEERRILVDTKVISFFDEWKDSLNELEKKCNRESAEYCEALWVRLRRDILNLDTDEVSVIQKKNIIDNIESHLRPFINRFEYKDYKKLDVDFIDNIPYILTFEDDLKIIYPMEEFSDVDEVSGIEESSAFVFGHIASSLILNPKEIIYLFKVNEDSMKNDFKSIDDAIKLFSTMKRLLSFKKRRELRLKVRLVILYQNDLHYAFEEYKFNEPDFSVLNLKIDDVSSVYQKIMTSNSLLDDQTCYLLEKSKATRDGWFKNISIPSNLPSYTFNCSKREFSKCNNAEWLTYVDTNTSLSARDISELSGRKYKLNTKFDFGYKGNSVLWEIYKDDTSGWKRTSDFLAGGKSRKITLLNVSAKNISKESFRNYSFYIPYSCYVSIKKCINKFKEYGVVDESSNAYTYSGNICYVDINCSEEMKNAIEKMVSKIYMLEDPDELTVVNERNRVKVFFSGLEESDLDLGKYIEKISDKLKSEYRIGIEGVIKKLYENGFIHNLIIEDDRYSFVYGSRSIRKLFEVSGNMLELRVFQELHQAYLKNKKEKRYFSDIVAGMTFLDDEGNSTEEIDTLVVKGFRTLLIECKARANLDRETIQEYVDKLSDRVAKFGIYSKGLLLIEGDKKLPQYESKDNVIVRRIDNIKSRNYIGLENYVNDLLD